MEGEEGICLGAEAEEVMPSVSVAVAAASLHELQGTLCLERLLLLLLLLQQVEP